MIEGHEVPDEMSDDRSSLWSGASVAITGACGTVGRELLRQVVGLAPARVVGIDNSETELFFLSQEYKSHKNVRLVLGDVRDYSSMVRKLDGVDIVLHTAAYKHVILCEQSPRDAIQTNIEGTQNVIDAALANDVQRMIFTSSDKAVNPTSVMGTSKLMGERLMTAANAVTRGSTPIFASTRFGNVLGSRGSVIPIFARQIAAGGPVTITNTAMTRFIMTLRQAVALVLESVFLARGGEVFVTKMPTLRIADLAAVMIEELAGLAGRAPADVRLEVIGEKPGEKLYEELINEEETRRTMEISKYFVVLPAFRSVYVDTRYEYSEVVSSSVASAYNSATSSCMTREEVRQFMESNELLRPWSSTIRSLVP